MKELLTTKGRQAKLAKKSNLLRDLRVTLANFTLKFSILC